MFRKLAFRASSKGSSGVGLVPSPCQLSCSQDELHARPPQPRSYEDQAEEGRAEVELEHCVDPERRQRWALYGLA